MADTNQPLTFDANKIAVWSIILAVLLAFLVAAKAFLIPLAIAFLVWGLLDAIRDFLLIKMPSRIPKRRAIATIVALLVIAAANLLVVNIIAGQLDQLSQVLPAYQQKFAEAMASLAQSFGIEELPSVEALIEKLDMGATLSMVGGTFGSLVGNTGLVLIYLGFIMAEEKSIDDKLGKLSDDPGKSERLVKLASEINAKIQSYIGMKTAISLLTGVISYLLLRGVGVDFAALWGLLLFLLNFIPNIGSLLGVAFPALMTLLQFDGVTTFFIVAAGLSVVQFFIGNILEPAYMGRSLNLSPLGILLSLSMWGAIWGLPGMLLSVPLMVVGAIICAHFEGLRWIAVLLSADGRIGAPSNDPKNFS
jgi:AI-2 transport protein TqsA